MIKRFKKNNGQMIALMGIILSVAVILISSLSAEIANLDIIVANEQSSSLIPRYNYFKETFPLSLTYNLAGNITIKTIQGKVEAQYYGNITDIQKAFNKTRDQYFIFGLSQDMIFDAELNTWYPHNPSSSNSIYYVNATISLDDGITEINEHVLYSISCKPWAQKPAS